MTRIFISHSHSDEAIAFKLVHFLMAALRLEEEEILCTSNPDQGLDFRFTGITDQLKENLKNSEALIILITADSLHSAWIPFEAGSFWTTDKPVIPILGPSLTQKDLPGPLRNLLVIPIDAQDLEDRLNNATNRLAKNLNLQQKITKIRNYTLQEFTKSLRAWKSKRPIQDLAQQQEIEELAQKIKAQEQSYRNQLQEMKVVTQKEKEELKQSLQSKITQLEQQLDEERLYAAEQIEEIKITSRQEKERLEQLLESLRSENKQLKQQLAEPTKQNNDSLEETDSISSFLNNPEEFDIEELDIEDLL